MTQPGGGFNVGSGVVSITADIDKAQLSRTMDEAGQKAGKSFSQRFAEAIKRDKSATTAAQQSGQDSGEATGRGFSGKLGAMTGMMAGAAAAVGVAVGAALVGSVMAAIDKENVEAQLSAKFGLSPAQTKAAGESAGKLYAQGFGESLGAVGDASGQIKQLTGASGKTLEDLTKQGLTLEKVFGYDVTESLNAAKNMVANGLAPNVKSAFDLIAKGSQSGLNANGDLLESLNEYSSQWSKLGIDGPAAFSLMSQAQKAGIKDTDLLNDAFKEFSLRAIDGSKTTTEAYKLLGLDADKTATAIAKGGPAAKMATDQVIKSIQGIKDPVKQNEAAVALFGTQFEDMGPKIFNSLDVAKQGFKDTAGTADEMANTVNNTAGAKLEQFKRRVEQVGTEIGGSLVGGFQEMMDKVGPIIDNLKALWSGEGDSGPFANLKPIVDNFKEFGTTVSGAIDEIIKAYQDNEESFNTFYDFMAGLGGILTTVVTPAFNALKSTILGVINVFSGIITFFSGVFTGDFSKAGDGLVQIWDGVWGAITGILSAGADAIKGIALGIWDKVKGIFTGIGNWLTEKWNGIATFFSDAWLRIKANFKGALDWIKALWTVIWDTVTTKIKSKLNEIRISIEFWVEVVKRVFENVKTKISDIIGKITDKFDQFKTRTIQAFTAAKDGVKKVWDKLQEVAKKPVNFVIDPVYKNIRELWNNIASKVGMKELPHIAQFAKGGIAPGIGNKDTVPAMLTPGEGILTKAEMKKIGGASGFAQLRKEIQYFSGGGIVGWAKDKLGGALRGSLYSGAKALADKYVYPKLNSLEGGDGFPGLMRKGGTALIDKTLNWIKADDKKNAAPAGSSGMGYKKMMQILQSKFPGLGLISGYRPGSRTLSGNVSYHASGRAVDVAPRRDVAEFINKNYRGITKELITPFQQYNLHNGQPHRYTGAIWNQHNFAGGNAHNHWAVDNGGVLKPKSTAVLTNATSDNEYMLTKKQLKDVVGETYVTNNITLQADQLSDMTQAIETLKGLGIAFNTAA